MSIVATAACAPYSRAQLEHQASLQPHNFYVVRDDAMLCPAAADATTAACGGAVPVAKNRLVWVLGYKPSNGVWQVRMPNNAPPMYIAASSVDKTPDSAAWDGFVEKLKTSLPASMWVPAENVNFFDLTYSAAAFGSRPVVFARKRSELPKRATKGASMRFGLQIPANRSGRGQALVMIDLPPSDVVDGLADGDYACDFDHCDEFMIIAFVTGKTVDVVDAEGRVLVAPLLRVGIIGDRYGEHVFPMTK
jgi:hypothetical protein